MSDRCCALDPKTKQQCRATAKLTRVTVPVDWSATTVGLVPSLVVAHLCPRHFAVDAPAAKPERAR